MVAVGLHVSLMSLTQTGQVSEVLLPSYHAIRETRGRDIAFLSYSALTNRFLLVLAALGALCWLLAPQLTRLRVPGFAPGDIAVATEMFRWILPLIVLQVGADLLKTMANAERMFGAPETVTVLARVVSLVAVLLLVGSAGSWALVVALWCAGLTELAGVLWLLRRRGYRHRAVLRLPQGTEPVRLFSKLSATLPYVGLTQIYVFVLDAALSGLAQGSFALFRYAIMIRTRTQAIFLRPISVTFFTQFSEATARGMESGSAMVERALARALALSAIVTTAVLGGAELVLKGLWESERFTGEQIATLVWLLAGLYVVLPVAGVATILRKAAVSLHRVRSMYLALAVVQVASALLAWSLVRTFGLVGAVIVSATNMFGFALAAYLVTRRSEITRSVRYPVPQLWRWLVAVVAGVAVGVYLQTWIDVPDPTRWLSRALSVATGGVLAIISATTALVVSTILGVAESRRLLSVLRSALERIHVSRR